jgi:hypothetical protein
MSYVYDLRAKMILVVCTTNEQMLSVCPYAPPSAFSLLVVGCIVIVIVVIVMGGLKSRGLTNHQMWVQKGPKNPDYPRTNDT